MKQQIFSLAIALPIVLASATSSFAGEAVKKPVAILTPIPSATVKPVVSKPVTGGGEDTHRNGEGSVTKKPVKPPISPRREPVSLKQRVILQPGLNSTLPNQNINRAPGY